MLPTELKLVSTNDCFIHLPESFINRDTKIKSGDIVLIKTIQSELELSVIWSGQLSPGNFAQLDLSFATANGFKEELIVLSLASNLQAQECSLCRVELEEAADYNILREHSDIRLLDTCRLVFKGMVIPLWVSKHIKVMVKVVSLEPSSDIGILTQSTEMQYLHSAQEDYKPNAEELATICNPIDFVSRSLGLERKTKQWPRALLVYGDTNCGKTHFLKTVMKNYSKFKSELYDCKQLYGKKASVVADILVKLLNNALDNQPFILALDDIDYFVGSNATMEEERGQEVTYRKRLVECFCNMSQQMEMSQHKKGHSVALIVTAKGFESLNKRLRGTRYFGKTLKIVNPDASERVEILKGLFDQHKEIMFDINDDTLHEISRQCRSFTPSDLKLIVERSIRNATSRSLVEFNCDRLKIQEVDLRNSLDGYLPINLHGLSLQTKDSTRFSDVGGMEEVKQTLRKTILLQLKYPKLFDKCRFQKQTSILLYGPPGCGKTLIAEALMNEEGVNSIRVNGPELLSKYIGASEYAVRNLFDRARMAKPCIIFLDEFESLVSKRGTDSTGVTDRVVNQFLTMMDGVERLSNEVFMVAATSRPDSIDPAILRPGRLSKHVYCSPPGPEERLEILEILTRSIQFEDPDTCLKHWAQELNGYTGADLQALLYDAQLMSLHEAVVGEPSAVNSSSNTNTDLLSSTLPAASLDLVLKHSHLQKAHDAMRVEVEKRHVIMSSRYPRAFNQLRNHPPGSRVTLN